MIRISKRFGAVPVAILALSFPLTSLAAKGKTQLELHVKPAAAQLFIDNKPQGKVGTSRVIEVTSGYHIVHLTFKGDEHEERIKIVPNQKTVYTFEFDEAPAAGSEASPDPVSPDSADSPKGKGADAPEPKSP